MGSRGVSPYKPPKDESLTFKTVNSTWLSLTLKKRFLRYKQCASELFGNHETRGRLDCQTNVVHLTQLDAFN